FDHCDPIHHSAAQPVGSSTVAAVPTPPLNLSQRRRVLHSAEGLAPPGPNTRPQLPGRRFVEKARFRAFSRPSRAGAGAAPAGERGAPPTPAAVLSSVAVR